ncbi:unnamed protein product, partial [Iphiclides podalirius]
MLLHRVNVEEVRRGGAARGRATDSLKKGSRGGECTISALWHGVAAPAGLASRRRRIHQARDHPRTAARLPLPSLTTAPLPPPF